MSELLAQKCLKGFGEFACDRIFIVDQYSFEERLIELTPEPVRGFTVRGFAVLDQGE
jgi:hypothetical protein